MSRIVPRALSPCAEGRDWQGPWPVIWGFLYAWTLLSPPQSDLQPGFHDDLETSYSIFSSSLEAASSWVILWAEVLLEAAQPCPEGPSGCRSHMHDVAISTRQLLHL